MEVKYWEGVSPIPPGFGALCKAGEMNWTRRLDINVDHKNGPYGHKKSIFTHFLKANHKTFHMATIFKN